MRLSAAPPIYSMSFASFGTCQKVSPSASSAEYGARIDGGGSLWLLDDIEHPATGIGLLYPPLPDALDTLGPRPAAAFVPPWRSRDILRSEERSVGKEGVGTCRFRC